MTDRCDDLHAYADGELDDAETAAFEAHLVTCKDCQDELPRLLSLLAALDDAAEIAKAASRTPQLALIDEPHADWPDSPAARDASQRQPATPISEPQAVSTDLARARRRRWPLAAGLGAALAAAAVVLLLVLPRHPASPSLAELMGPTRPIVARLSYPGADQYRPFDVQRGAVPAGSGASDRLLGLELEFQRAKNWHGLAVAALLTGDRERAMRSFADAPSTPDIDADRAALELLDGRPAALERALDDVARALKAAPGHTAAHWNRALVLAAMNLPLAAAQELDWIAALREHGWADEAQLRAGELRAQVVQRRRRWKRAHDEGLRLIDDGTPVSSDVLGVTGNLTLTLYDAVRAAPSRERVLALLPLATTLDRVHGSTRLTAYVQRIADADFKVRQPLADRYRELPLARATPAAAAALVEQLAQAGPVVDDIRLGALVFANQVGAQLDEYRKLAAATRDPWFTLIAENEAARAEIARGDRVAAERRLRDAIALAQREHLAYRAVRLEADLVKLHKTELALSQAADEALSEYRDAITAGEWVLEMGALSDLASIHHNRRAYNLARAYLTELALRADAGLAAGADDKIDCPTRLYAYESLANISLLELEPDHARAELVRAPLCDTQKISAPRANLILQNALVRSELYRLGHRAADAQLARDSLAALRELPANVAPGKDALLAYIEGDLIIKDDPATGQQSLRDAITRAAGHADEFSIKARLYSHALLALDAGRRSAFGDVIATVAESLRVRTPDRCAVAITVDADRSVVAFAGADAAIGGNYVAGRSSGQVDVTTLVPTSVVERMRGCEHVSVLTRAPILGAGRLLPPQLAWSYALVDPPAAPPAAAARRLVIANPQAPPDLSFPPLGPYPTEPGEPGVTILRGADATPSRVLAEMQNASVVEFHTHGFIADDLFEASYLVLSPELDRRYALTPDDVRQVRLAASPLVILGACHAATSSHSLEGGMGLAEAFLRAGARAVIASPDAVPDRDALAFFAAVRDRIVRGADPAVAVRDERTRRLSASHDESWASGVVVFQ